MTYPAVVEDEGMTENFQPESLPTVNLTVDERDVRMLMRSCRAQIRRLERDLEKSTFVPEEGKSHVTKASLTKALQVQHKLEAAYRTLQGLK